MEIGMELIIRGCYFSYDLQYLIVRALCIRYLYRRSECDDD